VAGAVTTGAGGGVPERILPFSRVGLHAEYDRHVAWSALSARFANDLDHGVPQPVCDLRSDRLDTDRDAQAWRNLRGFIWLRRPDAGDLLHRRPDACDAGRPQFQPCASVP